MYMLSDFVRTSTPPWQAVRNKCLTIASRLNGGVQFNDLLFWADEEIDDLYETLTKNDE